MKPTDTIRIQQYKNIFFALLIYATTLVFIPQILAYILISVIGLFYMLTNKLEKKDIFLFLFLLVSILIYYVGASEANTSVSKSANDIVPYTIFIVATIFFSKHLTNDVLKYILFFIILEIGVGMIEYALGKPYLIEPRLSLNGENEFGETIYLYYNRVYGLSAVTSVFAQKIMVGIILLFFLDIKKYRYIILSILIIGLFITFNRTAIIATLFFLTFIYINEIGLKKNILYIALPTLLLIILINIFQEQILIQFFRGRDEIDLSGRDHVFSYFISFFKGNWVWGNYTHKLWVALSEGRIYHAHNSYLQTIANLGLFLTSWLFIYITTFFNKKNILFIAPILIYSIFQYGILWGVSFLDIILFSILFITNSKSIVGRDRNKKIKLI